MGLRLELQVLLRALLGTDFVYFQPPPDLKMDYPAIVYSLDAGRSTFADNKPYRFKKRYQVTYISREPDDDIPDKLAMLPECTFTRFYPADNLNHYVFNLFF